MDLGGLTLLLGMAALGFRRGFDWDHIAAITDITSTTTAGHSEADVPARAPMPAHGHSAGEMRGHEHAHTAAGPGAMHVLAESRFAHEERHAIGLATLYALGHASVVVALGIAALLLNAVLPDWVDPILQKVVGVTLVLLGLWVLFSVYQYLRGKGDFRAAAGCSSSTSSDTDGERSRHASTATSTPNPRTPRSTARARHSASG